MTCKQYDTSREHSDPEAGSFADPLVLDRHRIVHSMAFRRLQYKTQVFLPFEADHFRTRMTHTLEVAHLAMVLADRFGVNRLAAEVICLAHDLGHGPFAHASERALAGLLAEFGGFEHNDQSVRVVTYLERPYPYFAGLNLTRVVLDALARQTSQLAGWADRLAYDAGDLEDALWAGLVSAQRLQSLALWGRALERIDRSFRDRPVHAIRRPVCEALQRAVIDQLTVRPTDEGSVIELSDQAIAGELTELEQFLQTEVYRHAQVAGTDAVCEQVIVRLFDWYRRRPDRLPQRYGRRRHTDGLERVIADYISGMTDRFCVKAYRQAFGDDDMLLGSLAGPISLGS